MFTAVLIDDEPSSLKILKGDLLEHFSNDVKVLAETSDFNEGVILIKEYNPDIVFLDIDLGNNKTGFDLLSKAREFNKVKGKDFIALVDIMRASSGLLNRGETLHPSLAKAYNSLPSEAKPSLNSFARHNITYGKGKTRENSGLLERMTSQSSIGNNVINSLTGASNEITHMVPA